MKNKTNTRDNIVVAHRGAWKSEQHPENSVAALKKAIALKCRGSEFDVRMTSDKILIVTHDSEYNDLPIEENTYKELANTKLSNGEILPTLRDYIKAGMKNNTTTGLVCEIKPSKNKEFNIQMAEKTLALVKELKAESYINSYISFSYDILKKIVKLNPNAKTQYLNGTKTPDQLKKDGISGVNYHFNVYRMQPKWIDRAKELGLTLNVWTVNTRQNLEWFLDRKFDFITTNEPELLIDLIKKK